MKPRSPWEHGCCGVVARSGQRWHMQLAKEAGAGDGNRTRDIQLGKLTLYQLSYARSRERRESLSGTLVGCK